jgi:mono/diheme cytochrome c family protein
MGGIKSVIRLAFFTAVAASCTTWAQDIGSTYLANCAKCHGADGRGNTVLGRAMKLRDLHSPDVQRLSEDELLVILSKGAERGRMAGFQKKLGAETLRQLAAYVRDIEHQPVPSPLTKKTDNPRTGFSNGDVKDIYTTKCSHCHGGDGAGNTVLGRALTLIDLRSAQAQRFSDDELIAIIAGGADGGRMPGFRKKLGPEMVEQVASYVRGLAGNPPIEARKKAANLGNVSEATPSEPVKPALQVEDHTAAIVQPGKQAQPQEQAGPGERRKASPLAKFSSAIVPARKTGSSTPLVDLNSASKQTLMTLPGITEGDAASIIAGRPYKSTLQFRTKGIVTPDTYARISGRVVAKMPARTTQPPVSSEVTE